MLILTENAITRLEGLEGMSRLQKLVLDKNKIKSVDESTLTVANLPHLSVLNLEYLLYNTFISSHLISSHLISSSYFISFYFHLFYLILLSLTRQRENYLKISACFSALSNLKVLTLGQNRIADISELDVRLSSPCLPPLSLTLSSNLFFAHTNLIIATGDTKTRGTYVNWKRCGTQIALQV